MNRLTILGYSLDNYLFKSDGLSLEWSKTVLKSFYV